MSANTALTQSKVAAALQRALEDTANEKGGKWGANGEAAATSGVIQFLQKYMRDDAKIIEKVKSGGKMKGAAAQLALTALEFVNKCGGVELSFGGRVAAADDKMQEEDAAPAAATGTPNGTRLRAHSAAINTLVGGKKLYGKLKYLQVYKSRYYEIEYNKITQGVAAAASTPFIAMVQSGAAANRQKLQQETIVSNKKIKDYKADIKKAEKNLIKANDGSFSTIKYEGSTLAYVSYEDSVMIDESGREYVPPLQDEVVDDAANNDAVGLGTPEPKKQRTE